MPFSLRLDPATEARIRRLSAATGRSRSQVVREAVAHYAVDQESQPRSGESAYDRVKAFAGVVQSGGANYSRDTHLQYRALLKQRHRARRAR